MSKLFAQLLTQFTARGILLLACYPHWAAARFYQWMSIADLLNHRDSNCEKKRKQIQNLLFWGRAVSSVRWVRGFNGRAGNKCRNSSRTSSNTYWFHLTQKRPVVLCFGFPPFTNIQKSRIKTQASSICIYYIHLGVMFNNESRRLWARTRCQDILDMGFTRPPHTDTVDTYHLT